MYRDFMYILNNIVYQRQAGVANSQNMLIGSSSRTQIEI